MKNKTRCDKCKKTIHKHIFNRFNKILCADCYSIEFQKKLYCGKYFTFYKINKLEGDKDEIMDTLTR